MCEHTVEERDTEKVLYYGTVAIAGAGAEGLTRLTIAIEGAGARLSPAVLSSHCCSMAAVLGLDG